MRIAVELNNIVRDFNSQVLKYYRKEIDPSFDDSKIDLKVTNLLDELPFKNQAERNTFKQIDFPYELYGCAKTTSKHLHVNLSDWLDENEGVEVTYFSIGESNLMIQSTYFFLSKGSRVKTMKFIDNPKEIWDDHDVVVTLNKEIVNSKPSDKKVIVIKKNDNEDLQKKADVVYEKFIEILADKDLYKKLVCSRPKISFKNKLTNKINKILPWVKN